MESGHTSNINTRGEKHCLFSLPGKPRCPNVGTNPGQLTHLFPGGSVSSGAWRQLRPRMRQAAPVVPRVSGLAAFPSTYGGRCRKSSLPSGSGRQQAAPSSTSLVTKNPPAEVIRPTSSQQGGALTSMCLVQVATPPQWRAQQSVAPSTVKVARGGPSRRRRSHWQDQVGGTVCHGTNSPRFRV